MQSRMLPVSLDVKSPNAAIRLHGRTTCGKDLHISITLDIIPEPQAERDFCALMFVDESRPLSKGLILRATGKFKGQFQRLGVFYASGDDAISIFNDVNDCGSLEAEFFLGSRLGTGASLYDIETV